MPRRAGFDDHAGKDFFNETDHLRRPLMAQEITPDAIMQLGFGYWGSKTLLSAVELGLFTELAKGPLALDEIRSRLNLHERSVRDFLDALVVLGMLKCE